MRDKFDSLIYQALLRDVSFDDYATSSLVAEAIADLNQLSDFRGQRPVTHLNLFRGMAPGCEIGPFMSQFFFW